MFLVRERERDTNYTKKTMRVSLFNGFNYISFLSYNFFHFLFLANKDMAGCLILALILTAVLAVTIFIPPELPHVTLVSLNVSKLNFTSHHNISGYVDMQFQVSNPNLLTDFCYGDLHCSLYRGERLLASTMFPGFFQGAKETGPISFTVYLTPITTAREIRKDLAHNYSSEEFDVKLDTFINWSYGSSKSVRVTCSEVPVGLVLTARGHGEMIGPARTCKVC